MSKKEIYTKIAGFIYDQLAFDVEDEDPNVTLADMGADSLDIVELAVDLESEFDFEIPDEDLCWENFGGMTVNDLVEYTEKSMEDRQ